MLAQFVMSQIIRYLERISLTLLDVPSVPNTLSQMFQEVFVESGSGVSGRSLIFEIVEYQAVGDDAISVGTYFWNDLSKDNASAGDQVRRYQP